jgi:hypothetical protein
MHSDLFLKKMARLMNGCWLMFIPVLRRSKNSIKADLFLVDTRRGPVAQRMQ